MIDTQLAEGQQITYTANGGTIILQCVRPAEAYRVSVLRASTGADVDELRRCWTMEDTARVYARYLAMDLNAGVAIDAMIEQERAIRAAARAPRSAASPRAKCGRTGTERWISRHEISCSRCALVYAGRAL